MRKTDLAKNGLIRNICMAENYFSIAFDTNWNLTVDISAGAIALAIFLLVSFIGLRLLKLGFQFRSPEIQIDSLSLGLAGNSIAIKRNDTNRQIAYAIWVELSTRKIGLPIDQDFDVIEEVYNSWYAFFGVVRELVKDAPVSMYRHDQSTRLIELTFEILNDGLRKHLTEWQSKFRRWYLFECEKDKKSSPQEIQRRFPEYKELMEDMLIINSHMINYRNAMKKLIS